MATIVEMRSAMMEMMAEAYQPQPIIAELTDDQIEGAFFMRKKDAEAIRDCCKKNNLKVSFRSAGSDTIVRINSNNPCKGHTILDKSIKKKDGLWTYVGTPDTLERLKGLVGFGDTNKTLKGVWSLVGGMEKKIDLGNLNQSNIASSFTGDYDMHDLIKNNNRILATTPDEHSIIEFLNNAMLLKDPTRKENVDRTKGVGRNYESPYALIRHGAQTSFMSFLLTNDGKKDMLKALQADNLAKLPYEDQVMNIDSNIVMFDENMHAFHLDSISKVYWYYINNKLEKQIPFYFFVKDLKNTPKFKARLDGFATDINKMIQNYVTH